MNIKLRELGFILTFSGCIPKKVYHLTNTSLAASMSDTIWIKAKPLCFDKSGCKIVTASLQDMDMLLLSFSIDGMQQVITNVMPVSIHTCKTTGTLLADCHNFPTHFSSASFQLCCNGRKLCFSLVLYEAGHSLIKRFN